MVLVMLREVVDLKRRVMASFVRISCLGCLVHDGGI